MNEQWSSSHQLTNALQEDAFTWEILIKKQPSLQRANLWAQAGCRAGHCAMQEQVNVLQINAVPKNRCHLYHRSSHSLKVHIGTYAYNT